MKRSISALLACLLAALAFTALDLGSKEWAIETLSRERLASPPPLCEPNQHGLVFMQRMRTDAIVLIEGYLELRYAENCGAAFGLLNDAPRLVRVVLFAATAVVAIVALLWMFVRGHGGALFAASVPLIVSGALGNLVDRIRHGYVVDFIRFHVHDAFEWPTFNIADAAITVGVVLLFLDGLRQERRELSEASPREGGSGPAEERASDAPSR